MSSTSPWPYKESPHAWAPPRGSPQVLAIPLRPQDKQLATRDQYLDRLVDRLEWMVEQEGGAEQVYQELIVPAADPLDLRGLDPSRPHLGRQMVEAWEDLLLQQGGLNQLQFPATVTNQSAAIHNVRQLSLADWLNLILPKG